MIVNDIRINITVKYSVDQCVVNHWHGILLSILLVFAQEFLVIALWSLCYGSSSSLPVKFKFELKEKVGRLQLCDVR